MDQLYLEPELKIASVFGRNISFRSAGEGGAFPLILLHGIGSNSSAWAGQFAEFSQMRRVIAWNAPGYLGSDALPMDAPAPEDYAAVLLGLLDALGIHKAILVGQSLGAIMATAAVLEQPDRFAALTLTSPASGYAVKKGDPLPVRVAERMNEAVQLGPSGLADQRAHRLVTSRASLEAQRRVHQAMAQVNVHGYQQASMMLAHADLAAMASRLRLPTLVMWGDEDVITPPPAVQRIAAAIPDGRSAALAHLGHGMATENPAAFNKILAEFLAEIDSSAEAKRWI